MSVSRFLSKDAFPQSKLGLHCIQPHEPLEQYEDIFSLIKGLFLSVCLSVSESIVMQQNSTMDAKLNLSLLENMSTCSVRRTSSTVFPWQTKSVGLISSPKTWLIFIVVSIGSYYGAGKLVCNQHGGPPWSYTVHVMGKY